MSINYWRYVDYEDDGVSCFQCLMCYNKWSSRTPPGWYDIDNIYHPVWTYCPYCGTKWIDKHGGGRSSDEEYYNERNFGPKRLKIYSAMRRVWEKPKSKPDYYNEKFWVIESRLFATSDWKQHSYQTYSRKYNAKDIKEIVEQLRIDEVDSEESYNNSFLQFRVVTTSKPIIF